LGRCGQLQVFTKLVIFDILIEERDGVSLGQAFAAFSQNTSIQELHFYNTYIEIDSEESFMIPLLNQLESITSINILSFGRDWGAMSVQLAESIRRLLAVSLTLQSIQFTNYEFFTRAFGPLLIEMTSSQSLQKIDPQ
jgi:hypothetical protein